MKRFTYLVVGTVVVLALALSASPAAAQNEGRDPDDRFEIGIQILGGLFSKRLDSRTQCNPISLTGLTADEACGPDNGAFDGETTDRFFVGAGGGVTANSGYDFTLWAGVDLNPHWQLEFSWDHSTANLAFEDESNRLASLFDVIDDDDVISNDGAPTGHLNIYQFNLNYHTVTSGKIIPYLGGGLGWVQFKNPPKFLVIGECESGFGGGGFCDNSGRVTLDEDTAFAFNLGGGVKFYPHKNFGIRLDVRQLFSFYDATHTVRTFEEDCIAGVCPNLTDLDPNDNNADIDQESVFTHLKITLGVFLRF